MANNIDKITPDEATNLILSFGDVNLVSPLFDQYGWTLNEEIRETLIIVRQNVNLGAKLSALKYLRQLVKETMETSGMMGTVSRTIPGADGSVTTFSAKRIATALNPVKQIKIQEINNDKKEPEEIDVGKSVGESDDGDDPGTDTGGDSDTGPGGPVGTDEIGLNGDNPCPDEIRDDGDILDSTGDGDIKRTGQLPDNNGNNPCIQHRPPTCDPRLYPGVSGESSAG